MCSKDEPYKFASFRQIVAETFDVEPTNVFIVGSATAGRSLKGAAARDETSGMADPDDRIELPDELPVVPLRQFVVFPYIDSKGPGSDAEGGNGVGPEVEIDSPPPPGEPIDVSPLTNPDGEQPPPPSTTEPSSGTGLDDLLGPVEGGVG